MSASMRRDSAAPSSHALSTPSYYLSLLLALTATANAAYIEFDNCLPDSQINSSPRLLQFVPLFVDAKFNLRNSSYPLDVTIYGNVTGQRYEGNYPPPNSSVWTDPNDPFGKITNITTTNNNQGITTLLADFDFLNYNAYTAAPSQFCDSVTNGSSCPLAPLFNANASDPSQLHGFSVQHDFYTPYAFSTLAATIRAVDGADPQTSFACVSANITPDIGNRLRGLLTWLPAAILIFKGIATLAAAIYSPWGSSDVFRWSSNYGRDEDLLRLVTPGFGDCLQYIQFIMLTGSLTVQYPGFYQPAVAQTSWSCLLFNESFVSHGPGMQNPIDGIYVTNGPYGMMRMSQLIGMTHTDDIWACMAVWLAVITAIVIFLCQLGFLSRWIYRKVTDTSEEDLRKKNLPFTAGNLIRLLFNFFILPIVALSFFQLITAADSPASVVAMSAILLIAMILSATWILRFIFRTKPRTFLFDDMPTVLLYGPLYNTYSDSAAPFAFVPVFITFVRGVAIGAVQPSGIAQIVILAICEVILILTVNGLRPFQNQTSMNLYHTLFSSVRLITVLLMIAFVPSLGVTEAPKGWIGYVILILHACVLVFGFFLNAAQTLLEVIARACGVGGNSRGNILSSRMLKRRQNRPVTADGQSLMSSANMVRTTDDFSATRSRSLSASSQQLLNQARTPSTHRLSGFETFSSTGEAANTGDAESSYFGAPGRAPSKNSTDVISATDNFYRPPRPRRGTMDLLTPGAKSRQSEVGADVPYSDSPGRGGNGYNQRDTLASAYLRDRNDSEVDASRPDYAVREVDQYYRGPALAGTGPTRKLKTGPADPQGPAANAQSWLQRMVFGIRGRNKQQEQHKGFEIVRSTRMPAADMERGQDGQQDFEMVDSPPTKAEPYSDSPPKQFAEPQTAAGAERDMPVTASNALHTHRTFSFESTVAPSTRAIHNRDTSLTTLNTLSTSHPALRPSMDTDLPSHPGLRAEMPSRNTTPMGRGHERSGSGSRPAPEIPELRTLSPIQSIGTIDVPSRYGSPPAARSSPKPEPADWLYAADRLGWRDFTRSPDLPQDTSYQPRVVPVVPGRSSLRPQSVAKTASVKRTPRWAAGGDADTYPESQREVETPLPGDNLAPSQDLSDLERPASFAVNHRRAGDSITRNSFGAGQIARTAELFHEDERTASREQ